MAADEVLDQPTLDYVMAETGYSKAVIQAALMDDEAIGNEEYDVPMPDADYLFPAIGSEDFRQRAIDLVKRIWKWVTDLYAWVERNFDSQVIRLTILEQRVQQTLFDLRGKSFSKTGTFEVHGYVNALSRQWRIARDVGEVTGSVTSLHRYLHAYYTYANDVLTTKGPAAVKALKGMGAPDRATLDIVKAASPIDLVDALTLTPTNDVVNGFTSKPLLGNMRLLVIDPKRYDSLSDIQRLSIKMARTTLTPGTVPAVASFPHFSRLQSENCLNQVQATIKTVRKHFNRDALGKQRRLKDEIGRLSTELTRQIDADTSEDFQLYQRLMVTHQLLDWTTRPWRSLTIHTASVLNGVRELCVDNAALSTQ